MFERFGLKFRSSDERFEDVEYATGLWHPLSQNLGSHVEYSWHSPKLYALELRDMPADWQAYVKAIFQGDRPKAQPLAVVLDVENLDAFCVKGIFGD